MMESRRCGLILALVLAVPCQGMASAGTPLCSAVEDLSSVDFLQATQAMRMLYEAGDEAIPYLIAAFSEKAEFDGICGSLSIESQVSEVLPLEGIGKPIADLPPPVTVREAALYLVIAIKRQNFYFAPSCRVHGLETRDRDLDLALGEIAILYARESCGLGTLSASEIDRILAKHHLTFE